MFFLTRSTISCAVIEADGARESPHGEGSCDGTGRSQRDEVASGNERQLDRTSNQKSNLTDSPICRGLMTVPYWPTVVLLCTLFVPVYVSAAFNVVHST